MKKIEAERKAEYLNKWVWPGVYYLNHGEQGRPIFKAANRGRGGWQVKIEFCYSAGTFYAPKDHFLESGEAFDYYATASENENYSMKIEKAREEED